MAAFKRIVICLDGTWNSPNEVKKRASGARVFKPSNVLKICRGVLPVDEQSTVQVSYYDLGVGSLEKHEGVSNYWLHKADKIFGGVWGAGFEGNVEDAAHFIIHNYQPGDEIYLFGFSRGAATARALANFLNWLGGIPTKDQAYYVPALFRKYLSSGGQYDLEKAKVEVVVATTREGREPKYMGDFQTGRVAFLGVWDTVMSLGGRLNARNDNTTEKKRAFHTQSAPPGIVKVARQALAIDERRWDFRPEIWQKTNGHAADQSLKQCWFAGAHSNTGGGLLYDGLANCSLEWMKEEMGKSGLGLAFDTNFLCHYVSYPQDDAHDSYSGMYKVFDGVRWRLNKGVRNIDQSAETNCRVHKSVYERLVSDHTQCHRMSAPYRPRNLLAYLATLENPEQEIQRAVDGKPIPEDLLAEIEKLRSKIRRP